MKTVTLILLILLYGVQAMGKSSHEAFDKLSLLISVKGFSKASEEEKLKTLSLLSSYFKESERESYNRIYHELLSLESLTINSLTLWKKCHKSLNREKNKNLLQYQCKKLIPNSLNKYSLLEKEIQVTLMPLILDFEKQAQGDSTTKIRREFSKHLSYVISDLKKRISELKKIEVDYKNGDFEEAQKKVAMARALLGA